MKLQFLTVRVPEDFENPDRLVQAALEHYLERGDRWREVDVRGGDIIEIEDAYKP